MFGITEKNYRIGKSCCGWEGGPGIIYLLTNSCSSVKNIREKRKMEKRKKERKGGRMKGNKWRKLFFFLVLTL